ncbi:MAG: PspA/IM30 family protein, partial [Bacteroidota bacterium]
ADGNMDASKADRLATQALIRKEESFHQASCSMGELLQFEESIDQLESNISRLKATIGEWENELSVLKARDASFDTSDETFYGNSSEAIVLLERMKAKVAKDEYLTQAYKEVIDNTDHIDWEIDQAIKAATKADKSEELQKLKSTLGLDH